MGPTDACTWQYTGYGERVECGRSDEVSPTSPEGCYGKILFRFSWEDVEVD